MAKDPAFLFYPGDYLRDTQCLSEKTQVAYDRIMCEHMRNTSIDVNNIIVSKDKVTFFTKRLSEEERQELFTVMVKRGNGYQIEWVAESIADRRLYSESRSKNRSKKDESHENTSEHMEDDIEIKDANGILNQKLLIPEMFAVFKKAIPTYPGDIKKDFLALGSISTFIYNQQSGLNGNKVENKKTIIKDWEKLCEVIAGDKFFKSKPLSTISNQIQEIYQLKNGTSSNQQGGIEKSIKTSLSKRRW